MARNRCPCAAARRNTGPVPMVKSALPASTALGEADAHQVAVGDLQAFLLEEAGILGDERGREGQRLRRNREDRRRCPGRCRRAGVEPGRDAEAAAAAIGHLNI